MNKKITLIPLTNKAKQIINRDGSTFILLGGKHDVIFSELKDWFNLQSVDNPKNGRWIQRNKDVNFNWKWL